MAASRSTTRTTPTPEPVVADETPEPEPARCAFPREMRGDRCPVAVFNCPTSPNERISVASGPGGETLRFLRGLLAVFEEREAPIVRRANPGGNTYIEANPRLADNPLVCTTCYPPTRWYSQEAYQRHTTFAHVD